MKLREATANRLVLRSHPVIGGAITLLIGLGLGFFGLVDIVDNDGGNGGWYGLPVGLLTALAGLAVATMPVDYVLNRQDRSFVHIRRGWRTRVLQRKELPARPQARVTEQIGTNSKGAPKKSYGVSLQGQGQPVSLAGFGRRSRAEALANLVNDWLDTGSP